jgi:DNA-binding NarL/FixJ family response regulator
MKILLVDDHAIVRFGLRGLIAAETDTRITEASNAADALMSIRLDKPDLILLDLNLAGTSGMELLRQILAEDRTVRVIILTMTRDSLQAARAIKLGAHGYLSKSVTAEELLTAIARVSKGARYIETEIAQKIALQSLSTDDGSIDLTDLELEIIRGLEKGMSAAEIAATLDIERKHVTRILSALKVKLGVSRTSELARFIMKFGTT